MNKCKAVVTSILLSFFGGTLYYFLEIIWKSFGGHPERISWIMLPVAILLSFVLERCGYYPEWEIPLLIQCLFSTCMITITEYITGYIFNIKLGMGIWDYTDLPLNLDGQICLPYCIVWFILSFIFIPVFDWIRYILYDCEDKPHYTII